MAGKATVRFIKNTLFNTYLIICKICLWPLLHLESVKPPFTRINGRVVEYEFALKWLGRICPTEVLDIGSGKSSWPHTLANCGFRVTAIDKISGYWTRSCFFNRHFKIIHDDITNPRIGKQYDFLTCIGVLGHIPNHDQAVEGMFKLLKPGGHLILTFAFNENCFINNIYDHPQAGYRAKDYICRIYSRKEIDGWFKNSPGSIIEQEYYETFTGDFWTFGERIYPQRKVERGQKCHFTCMIIKKNG